MVNPCRKALIRHCLLVWGDGLVNPASPGKDLDPPEEGQRWWVRTPGAK